MNGFFAAPSDLNGNTGVGFGTLLNPTGGSNTAIGAAALDVDTTGNDNTASGNSALLFNTSGSRNTAIGQAVLSHNTSGSDNTAIGEIALWYNTTGIQNTASGVLSLGLNTTGSYNAASGYNALFDNSTGDSNTASGYGALQNNMTGSSNIGIGASSAMNAPAGNSNSIYIGSQGSDSDRSGTIQIGTAGTQTSFFIAGVSGVTTGANNAVPVVIDSNGQLGTMSSSARFKEDIEDMGAASSGLLRLRPVTFRYKQAYADGSKPIDYGLIAEDVAQVYPDLVVRNKEGEIQTVQYQKLTPMLLNELQKHNQRAQRQDETIRQLQERLAVIESLFGVAPAATPMDTSELTDFVATSA